MTAATLLRQSRRAEGLTQRDLAQRAGVHQPAIADIERHAHDTRVDQLDTVLAAAGRGLFALPTRARSAADWGDVIYDELRAAGGDSRAFRALIALSDDLAALSGALRVALSVAPPALCGDGRFDAAIAAVVEHRLAEDGLPIPSWVDEPERQLAEPWVVSRFTDPSTVPAAFRRHGVLLAVTELGSV